MNLYEEKMKGILKKYVLPDLSELNFSRGKDLDFVRKEFRDKYSEVRVRLIKWSANDFRQIELGFAYGFYSLGRIVAGFSLGGVRDPEKPIQNYWLYQKTDGLDDDLNWTSLRMDSDDSLVGNSIVKAVRFAEKNFFRSNEGLEADIELWQRGSHLGGRQHELFYLAAANMTLGNEEKAREALRKREEQIRNRKMRDDFATVASVSAKQLLGGEKISLKSSLSEDERRRLFESRREDEMKELQSFAKHIGLGTR